MASINFYDVALFSLSQNDALRVRFKILIESDGMILDLLPGPFTLDVVEEFVNWWLITMTSLGSSCIRRKQNSIMIFIRESGHNLVLNFSDKVSMEFIMKLKEILGDAKKGSVKEKY